MEGWGGCGLEFALDNLGNVVGGRSEVSTLENVGLARQRSQGVGEAVKVVRNSAAFCLFELPIFGHHVLGRRTIVNDQQRKSIVCLYF